jgi:hypothetical protein
VAVGVGADASPSAPELELALARAAAGAGVGAFDSPPDGGDPVATCAAGTLGDVAPKAEPGDDSDGRPATRLPPGACADAPAVALGVLPTVANSRMAATATTSRTSWLEGDGRRMLRR